MNHFFFAPTARTAGMIALITTTAFVAGCSKSTTSAPQTQVVEVGVFKVAQEALQMTTEMPGRTTAYQVAEVRPQVSGLIKNRLFVEGADVKQGSALYQIDAAIYQASVNSASAALDKAKARLLTSGPKVARYRDLVEIEGVSRQDYEDAIAADVQARADVAAATAALAQANIDLRYTHVYAPISGRISRSSVTPGALVTANQAAALATVQQLDPIYIDVTQSSEELIRLKRDLASGSLKRSGQVKVTLRLADGSLYAETGKLQFSEVTVDHGTDNVTLRALFPNPRHDLLPGMFVRAMVDTGVNEKAIAAPQQGVTRNQKGEATALVLNAQGKVEQRTLVTTGTMGDKWLVKSGLAAGDLLIVEGLQKVKAGQFASAAKVIAPTANSTASTGGATHSNAQSAH